ncbi:unnamed protein product [Trifolium pratense]|uniref:Uncharacterized protein n=1 Tax=Trifolium pratense TaxID=57577 RepID=A0ACB0KX17_TRIPR|nr:unnamed protein product [Trifolium pratense]
MARGLFSWSSYRKEDVLDDFGHCFVLRKYHKDSHSFSHCRGFLSSFPPSPKFSILHHFISFQACCIIGIARTFFSKTMERHLRP